MSATSSLSHSPSLTSLTSGSSVQILKNKESAKSYIDERLKELCEEIAKINILKNNQSPRPSDKLIEAYNIKSKEIVQKIQELVNQYNLLVGKKIRHFCIQLVNTDGEKKEIID